MQRSNVLFPEPLRPIMHTTSRGATSIETCFRTCKRPKYLSSLVICTIGAISAISPGKTAFDTTLQSCQNQRHDPIEDSRHNQCFEIMELSTSHLCCTPHQFMHKTRCGN